MASLAGMTSRGSSAVAHAAEAAGQYAHQAVGRARDRDESAEGAVRHDPARSVAVVFGMASGRIVGLAIRHR